MKCSSETEGGPYHGPHTLVVRRWEVDQRHSGRSSNKTSENRICDLSFATMKLRQLQCSSLAQMKIHYHHLFRGENVTSSLSFTSGGGLHRSTTIAYWLRESTLECFRLNLSLHTWCKVISSTRVRTRHCTFSRYILVHSRHLSTIVQELISRRTPLSPPRPRTSLPSLNWHQQSSNHFSTVSYLGGFHHLHAVQRVGTWSEQLSFTPHREIWAKM